MFEEIKQESIKYWESLNDSSNIRISVGISSTSISLGAGRTLSKIRKNVEGKYPNIIVSEVGDIGFSWADPVVHVSLPDSPTVIYGNITEDKVPVFLDKLLNNLDFQPELALGVDSDTSFSGIPVLNEQPWMKNQKRVIMQNFGKIAPTDFQQYVANGGFQALDKVLSNMSSEDVITEVRDSGLKGRGGALFPTGVKWGFMLNATEGDKYLAINGEEGDPGAFTDVSIVENDPYRLLEGVLIASYAMGCNKSYIHIRAEYQLAVKRLTEALSNLENIGFTGVDIMGSGFNHEIEIEATGHAYICGEETALMESVEGKRGAPRPRPPFPAGYGIFGRPTNINNVKTIAYVPSIINLGADAFKNIGTENASGTALLSLSGHAKYNGIAEIPVGLNLNDVIQEIAGGIKGDGKLKALQCGGPLGGIMPASELDMPTEFQEMSGKGSPLGSGGIMILSEDTCIVDLVKNIAEFNEEESCGKCFPCRKGTTHIVQILKGMTEGFGDIKDFQKLENIGNSMIAGSLCGLGQLAPGVLNSAVKYFSTEFKEHVVDKICRTGSCLDLNKI